MFFERIRTAFRGKEEPVIPLDQYTPEQLLTLRAHELAVRLPRMAIAIALFEARTVIPKDTLIEEAAEILKKGRQSVPERVGWRGHIAGLKELGLVRRDDNNGFALSDIGADILQSMIKGDMPRRSR